MRTFLCLATLLIGSSVFAQWEDVKRIGNGGETYVSSDGNGTVYASSHIPVQVVVSRDWGATFSKPFEFPDSLGDMVVYARPEGKAVVSYMYPLSKSGMSTWNTSDFGKTWKQGTGIPGRPLDREWIATDEKTGACYMIYSDGYIGGPKSKGVYCAKSDDGGLTWKQISRCDKEAEGDYPVDPHIVNSSDGKLYALWTTSKDYNTIDTYKCSVSTDGGKTWANHTLLADVTKKVGDTAVDVQERWMLGGLAAYGPDEVMAFFVNWMPVDVYGTTHTCLAIHVRYSHDAGKTWGEPTTVVNKKELETAAKLYYEKRQSGDNYPDYIQCLGWGCYDGKGTPHFIWQDNRYGQAKLGEKDFNRWHVRHAWSGKAGAECVTSEQVSKVVTCKRPPLDFLCACADSKYLYVTWTETPGKTTDWEFTGEFYFGRKKID